MAKQTDRTAYPLVVPANGGYILGVDPSDTSKSPQGTTKAFYLDRLGKTFETRAAFVTAVAAGYTQPNGNTTVADGIAYKAQSGATAISDLPGWVPARGAELGHFPSTAEFKSFVAQSFTIATSGGDFASFTECLDWLDSNRNRLGVGDGQGVLVNVESGFTMAEQVVIAQGDWSWITFTSDDAYVPIDRSSLTQPDTQGIYYYAWDFRYCVTPIMQLRFDMDTSGTGTNRRGMKSVHSRANLNASGVINAANRGYVAYNSQTYASSSIWDGAGTIGFRVANGGTFLARSISAQNCGDFGANIRDSVAGSVSDGNFSGATNSGLVATGSQLHMENIISNNSGGNGLQLGSGVYYCANATLNGNGSNGLFVSCAKAFADGADCSGNTNNGIEIISGGDVTHIGGTANNNGQNGVSVDEASSYNGENLVANSNGASNALINGASKAHIDGANLDAGVLVGLKVYSVSSLSFRNGSCEGHGGASSIITESSSVDLRNTTFRLNGTSASTSDLNFQQGSTINATGATGGWPGSTANAISGSRGIVWQE